MSKYSGNRKSRRQQLKASHQKNWLTGRHAILEALRAGKWPIEKLILQDDGNADYQQILSLAKDSDVTVESADAARIEELCHSTHHQGVIARMRPYPYHSAESVSDCIRKESDSPALVVICDRIQDTHNFGAILRCCDAMKVDAVLIGDSQQAAVTPQVARSSAGAVNYMRIAVSEDLSQSVSILRSKGLRIAVASEKPEGSAWTADLSCPLALIIGSEAHGVSDELLQLADERLKIPMMGSVDSLNASVAAGILLYEIRRQQIQNNAQ